MAVETSCKTCKFGSNQRELPDGITVILCNGKHFGKIKLDSEVCKDWSSMPPEYHEIECCLNCRYKVYGFCNKYGNEVEDTFRCNDWIKNG